MDEENRAIPCLIHIFFRILILTLIFGRILINNGLNFCRENIVFEINISEPFSSSNKVNRRSSSSKLFPSVEFFPCQLLRPTSPVDRLFNLYLPVSSQGLLLYSGIPFLRKLFLRLCTLSSKNVMRNLC